MAPGGTVGSTESQMDSFHSTLTVVIYGTSLALSSIGANLEGHPGLLIAEIDGAAPGAEDRLLALNPDAVIFDLASEKSDILAFWTHHPHLLLIGLDLTNGRARVLSYESSYVATPEDLLHIIETHARGGPSGRGV